MYKQVEYEGYTINFNVLCSYKDYVNVMNVSMDQMPKALAVVCEEDEEYLEAIPFVYYPKLMEQMKACFEDFLTTSKS